MSDEARRRHDQVYRSVAKPFARWRVAERLFAGRNPLTEVDVAELAALGVLHVIGLRVIADRQRARAGPAGRGSVTLDVMRNFPQTRVS